MTATDPKSPFAPRFPLALAGFSLSLFSVLTSIVCLFSIIYDKEYYFSDDFIYVHAVGIALVVLGLFGLLFSILGIDKTQKNKLAILGIIYGLFGCISACFVFTASVSSFADVKADKWYATVIEYCVENDIMSGDDKNKFHPDKKVTRAQGIQALYALDGCRYVSFETLFSDVEDDKCFSSAVIWGAKSKVVAGLDYADFGPDFNVTREQMAVFFFRYANHVNANTSASADLATFPDNANISTWAVASVQWAVAAGILSGKAQLNGPPLLAPKNELTRAEFAAVMMRFHQFINELNK